MCSGADVVSHVDAPQLGAVQLVTVEYRGAGEASMCIVGLRAGLPFHDQFVFAVRVHVGSRAVVGRVMVIHVMEGAVGGAVEAELHEHVRPRGDGVGGVHRYPVVFGHDAVGGGPAALGVEVVGRAVDVAFHHRPVFDDVKGRVVVIGVEHAPAHQVAAPRGALRYGHHAACQLFGSPFCVVRAAWSGGQQQGCHAY